MTRLILFTLLIIITCSCTNKQGFRYDFDMQEICKLDDDCEWVKEPSHEGAMIFRSKSDSSYFEFAVEKENVDWNKAKYLVCEVYHENDFSALLYFNFYRKEEHQGKAIVQQGEQNTGDEFHGPRIAPKIGVLPKLRTQVIFPLSHLDGQQIFIKKYPRQMKGTVLGNRMSPTEISKIQLVLNPFQSPYFLPEIQIYALYLTDELPKPLPPPEHPVIDKFGQWTAKDWKGKIKSDEALKNELNALESDLSNSTYPSEWSEYGGYKQLKFDETGYFHTHFDGNRWWLVDPSGYAFLSTGVDCMSPSATTAIEGNENLFEVLPSQSDSLYKDCYSPNNKGSGLLVDLLKANYMRVYGSEWEQKWTEISKNMIKKYRLNTVANWSSIEFAQQAKVPYVLPLRNFPTTETLLFRDFPDVFNPIYSERAIAFASQLENYKNDKYLIGYFLANEPKWAFGEFNLAFEMFGTSTSSYTKRKLIEQLKNKYQNNLKAFNNSWKLEVKAFDELQNRTFRDESELSEKALKDLNEFSGTMVDQYIKVVCDEVKKIDSNHLNLGLRYAWISSELCYRAGEFFDVFSINGYSFPGPPETAELYERSGKPIMIGEFHFGSIDRGLPATGIQGAENQQARADAYRYYLENGFARPEIIGMHYFQWNDQPVLGRSDGENYNIGFMNICGIPYPELTEAASITHERMYQVAKKEIQPFSKIIKKIPQIYY
ncbi:MAG: hypothetical protein K9G70_01455 [Prolixibacteraceae bacterium]|nr:hypothetical protein [Prolixibacteraceae bacterium]